MGSSQQQSGLVPDARATALFARTIHRELRRVGYAPLDLLRFVNEFLELLTGDVAPSSESAAERGFIGVIDAETGLPNAAVLGEALEFEMRRAEQVAHGALLVLSLEALIPEWFADDAARAVHLRTTTALRQRLRGDDTVGRLDAKTYLLILPNATAEHVPLICARLVTELSAERPGEVSVAPFTFLVRSATWAPGMQTSAELLEQCLAATPVPLVPRPPVVSPATEAGRVLCRADLATPVSGRSIVLALGGGAARAAAHLGVLRVIRRAGLEVAAIAGTSAGALVASMYLCGLNEEEILDRFVSFSSTPLFRRMREAFTGYAKRAKRARPSGRYFRQSGLSFLSDSDAAAIPDDVFADFIEHFVGPDRDMSRMGKPFATTATDLVEGRGVVCSHGMLHAALRATCALPGLFAPQVDGDRILVDGSVISEVPVGAAFELGLPVPVLAVHLARTSQRIARFSTSVEVLTRTSALIHTELVREQLRNASMVLTVPVGDVGWLDFRRAARLCDIGETAARMDLEALLRQVTWSPTTV